jgi:hypothetical protein
MPGGNSFCQKTNALEETTVISGTTARWPTWACVLAGSVLLLLALALAGGPALLSWGGAMLLRWPLPIAAVAALYLAPGLALLRLLWPRDNPLPLAAYLALAAGVSVALPPLLLLLFHTLSLPWNGAVTRGYVVVSLLVALVGVERNERGGVALRWPYPWRDWRGSGGGGSGLLLAGITLAALLVRLFIVRDVPTGLFGDSYHHTMMAQLLVDNRGLFASWQPYAPLSTFTYHFGFHSNAAFVHWMSGDDVIPGVLLVGQVLNALAVPMAFLLVVALGGSVGAGVWAALLTGFVSTIPAFYVVWGRYTQLTGQIVLVPVVVAWIAALDPPPPGPTLRGAARALVTGWRGLLLAALMTAAIILTHYLVTVFAALFVASYGLALALARRSWRVVGTLALLVVVVNIVTLLLALPWLLNLFNGYLIRNASSFVNEHVDAKRIASYATLPEVVPRYAKAWVLAAALVGLGIAAWRRDWRMALPGLWSVLLVICMAPHIVGLPGTGLIDYLTALSAWYLTLLPLAGYALAAAYQSLRALLHRLRAPPIIATVLAGGVLLLLLANGTREQTQMIDGTTQMVTHADMQAMDWIRRNTSPDARFLVNSFPAYGGTLVAGTDAGWWLPLLTGRQTNLPPLTYGSEWGEREDFAHRVNTLARTLRGRKLTNAAPVTVNLTTPEALATLRGAAIDYVYSGAHPSPEKADRINTTLLRKSPAFRLVYQAGGVEIFQIVTATREKEKRNPNP